MTTLLAAAALPSPKINAGAARRFRRPLPKLAVVLDFAFVFRNMVVFRRRLCHNPASRRPACKGLPWRRKVLNQHAQTSKSGQPGGRPCLAFEESQMPKIKTKSGAKKRFKVTGSGKVLYAQAGKRHGMIKRTKKQIRQLRGTNVLFKSDGDNIKKYFLPNG
jgi:large subunit ribosomal protein L35